jgi:hypothetical protein
MLWRDFEERPKAHGVSRSRRIRWLRLALAGLASFLLAMGTTQAAQAYYHFWGGAPGSPAPSNPQICWSIVAYGQCWDGAGQTYNAWVRVEVWFQFDFHPSNYNGTCAKAITEAGNVKSGSTCSAFDQSGGNLAASPSSRAYGYWGGSGAGPVYGADNSAHT